LSLPKKEAKKRLKEEQRRLLALRLRLGGQTGDGELGPPVCIVFEGWDASGKGGAVKRLVRKLDPRHFRVRAFSAPNEDELRHHWLWRFWPELPGWGGMTVFDRSWYGRVMVERVEGFASREEWGRAYEEINAFEQSLADEGTTIVKLWLQISPEEQLKRFEARAGDPLKSWKLTDEDWRNREKLPQYTEAVEEMLERTDKPHARWRVVPGESKRFARVEVMRLVIEEIEAGMRRAGQDPPPPP